MSVLAVFLYVKQNPPRYETRLEFKFKEIDQELSRSAMDFLTNPLLIRRIIERNEVLPFEAGQREEVIQSLMISFQENMRIVLGKESNYIELHVLSNDYSNAELMANEIKHLFMLEFNGNYRDGIFQKQLAEIDKHLENIKQDMDANAILILKLELHRILRKMPLIVQKTIKSNFLKLKSQINSQFLRTQSQLIFLNHLIHDKKDSEFISFYTDHIIDHVDLQKAIHSLTVLELEKFLLLQTDGPIHNSVKEKNRVIQKVKSEINNMMKGGYNKQLTDEAKNDLSYLSRRLVLRIKYNILNLVFNGSMNDDSNSYDTLEVRALLSELFKLERDYSNVLSEKDQVRMLANLNSENNIDLDVLLDPPRKIQFFRN